MDIRRFNRLLSGAKYDKKAFEQIYEEYYPKIVLHLRRRFGDLMCIEDAAENVFLYLLTIEPWYIDYPTSWLFTIAENDVKDHLKAQYRELPLLESTAVPYDFDREILSSDMQAAFAHLDKDAQMILYLHHWEGYAHDEIAKELHISPSNVRVKVSRAYKILKKYL